MTSTRKDSAGIEWFACDPYPTWYRWADGRLETRDNDGRFIGTHAYERRDAAPWATPLEEAADE